MFKKVIFVLFVAFNIQMAHAQSGITPEQRAQNKANADYYYGPEGGGATVGGGLIFDCNTNPHLYLFELEKTGVHVDPEMFMDQFKQMCPSRQNEDEGLA